MSLIHLSVKEIISNVGYPLSLSSKASCYNNNVDKFLGKGQLASGTQTCKDHTRSIISFFDRVDTSGLLPGLTKCAMSR